MPKSCFDGYLTPECAKCGDWSDGAKGKPLGCNCGFPISWCKAFSAMCEAEEKANAEQNQMK